MVARVLGIRSVLVVRNDDSSDCSYPRPPSWLLPLGRAESLNRAACARAYAVTLLHGLSDPRHVTPGGDDMSSLRGDGLLDATTATTRTQHDRVEGEPPGPGQRDRERPGGQHEHELEAARLREEPGLAVCQHSRRDHVDREQRRDDPRRNAEHQERAADELQPGDERSGDLGERDAHAGEARGDGGDALPDLLGSVGDEDHPEDDAQDGQADGCRCRSHGHDRTR